MYLYKQKKPNGDIYLAIKEKYHVPGKGARERTIERIGYLSELKDKYDDPIAYFTQYAKELTNQMKKDNDISLNISMNKKMTTDTNIIRNVGYGIIKEIYQRLEINEFWSRKKLAFNINDVFLVLILSQIFNRHPACETLTNVPFFEPFNVSPHDIKEAQNIIRHNHHELQKWIFNHTENLFANRDLNSLYLFDFDEEIDDEIVRVGLLLDTSGVPVACDFFSSDESEKTSIQKMIREMKNIFRNTHTIIVARNELKELFENRKGYNVIVSREYEKDILKIKEAYQDSDCIEADFTAHVIVRLLEKMLDDQYSAEQIIESLKKYNCAKIGDSLWHFTYYDKILEDCGKALRLSMDNEYRRQNDIRRMLHY